MLGVIRLILGMKYRLYIFNSEEFDEMVNWVEKGWGASGHSNVTHII